MLRTLKTLLLTAFLAVFATQSAAMFIQPDWFDVRKEGVGTNRYSYSLNDPVNRSDPTGNLAPAVGIVAGIIGLFGMFAADEASDRANDGKRNGNGVISGAFKGNYDLGNSISVHSEGNDGDTPGIGHNGGPAMDEGDPSQGDPNNEDPDAVTAAAIAAVVASQQTQTKTPTEQGITISEVDGNTVSFSVNTEKGPVDVVADISVKNGILSLSNAHVQGDGPNTSSIGALRSAVKSLGRAFGVDQVSFSGGTRTSGANPGRTPGTVNISVD
ncbi:hypothetical protein [Leisingera sp. ANG-M7]|uniref:hypothetical protein n=1 Tax=Leisingera sp. ANG-M7 TaxID=1577902 RepID=UPI001269E3C2|nr:hypothetical protein [Leisingera sp. ANG-M7]